MAGDTRMRGIPWRDQIQDGRVFELRSTNRQYPPPCALVIHSQTKYERAIVRVDAFGVVGDGLYHRSTNPNIPTYHLRDLDGRIVRRRRDLERFDKYDLDLIRYGCAVDFDGQIQASFIPHILPCKWTVFWWPPYEKDDFFYPHEDKSVFRGAWYFEMHGGPRHLGYKYGHMFATRHADERLNRIRRHLKDLRGDLIEMPVHVVRWEENGTIVTTELRRDCPIWSSRFTDFEFANGNHTFTCHQ